MSDNKNKIEYDGKQLPEVFEELKKMRQLNQYSKKKFNFDFYKNVKLNKANRLFIIILLICFIIITLLTTSISATQVEINEVSKIDFLEFEKSDTSIELMDVLNENMSIVKRKELIVREDDVNFFTTYIDNPNLPSGEQVIVQNGEKGKQELTVIRTYENDELIEENIISINIFEDAVEEIVEVGSSKFLDDLKIHLGDTIYLKNGAYLKSDASDESENLAYIPEFLDLKLLETTDKWQKVSYNELVGFVDSNKLTSGNIDSEMPNKCRIQKIKLSINIDMPLNVPSGLTEDDFKKILSNISSDKNKIFENNALVFYKMEQKYNINGVFLASIAIHESGWGTSRIAVDKKNLFGYGAYDATPYQSSFTFDTYEAGIEIVARALVKNYLNQAGTEIYEGQTATAAYYNGPTVAGVNVRYASDTNWHVKVFTRMLYLYERL